MSIDGGPGACRADEDSEDLDSSSVCITPDKKCGGEALPSFSAFLFRRPCGCFGLALRLRLICTSLSFVRSVHGRERVWLLFSSSRERHIKEWRRGETEGFHCRKVLPSRRVTTGKSAPMMSLVPVVYIHPVEIAAASACPSLLLLMFRTQLRAAVDLPFLRERRSPTM